MNKNQITTTDDALEYIEERFRAFETSDQASLVNEAEEIARDYTTCACCERILTDIDFDTGVCECGAVVEVPVS